MPQLVGDATKARIFAFVIDNLIACLISILIVGKLSVENGVVSATILSLTYLSYFFVFELAFARTPGKMLQGLVIRKVDGGPCTAKQIFFRTLTRIFEANPILFGGLPAGLMVATSTTRQRMGDVLAGTVVVSKDISISEET